MIVLRFKFRIMRIDLVFCVPDGRMRMRVSVGPLVIAACSNPGDTEITMS